MKLFFQPRKLFFNAPLNFKQLNKNDDKKFNKQKKGSAQAL
jgi:hypothetical protein